ncbi:hypothetical protein Cch01nite_09330 [Cellulomonas chitinilytica]|uniref:Uncharacterized protein n=1 Tax=Cellulomonas chitinilytica TaxID=398759 RepID=A0A919P2E9_9CELL|nr:hypothetical protein [Cellulomonas chitinilytica]GIG20209.1 hypothetical protein Cch01nite_09330 [Cellulomonas chitinilytica]
MTLLVGASPPPATERLTPRTLVGVEARRFARHPLFLTGVALLVASMATASDDLDATVNEAGFLPAVFLGVFGTVVAHQLVTSMDRSADAADASPTGRAARTVALCTACLVPGAVAVAWLAWMYVAMAVWPVPASPAYSSLELAAMLTAGVVYAIGGPLVGVAVARWVRMPGAGVLAALLLVGWGLLGTVGLSLPPSTLGTLARLHAPFAAWVSSDGPGAELWLSGGSPAWYLMYVTLLCGLAATVAELHDTTGARRARVTRTIVALVVLALVSLVLAVTDDPTRIPL